MPSWIKETYHAISPDGKAALYESIINGNNVSVGTWVIADIGSGGAGVFDIQTPDSSGVNLSWLSESTALVKYPQDAKIIRQEDSTFFAGRTIYLNYSVK